MCGIFIACKINASNKQIEANAKKAGKIALLLVLIFTAMQWAWLENDLALFKAAKIRMQVNWISF